MNRTLGSYKTFLYTPAADVAAGDIVIVGELIGIAPYAIKANTVGAVERFREVELTYDGKAEAAQGAKAYWNDTDKVVTVTGTGNTAIGCFSVSAASTAAKCRVFLS